MARFTGTQVRYRPNLSKMRSPRVLPGAPGRPLPSGPGNSVPPETSVKPPTGPLGQKGYSPQIGQSELGQFQIRSGPTWDIPLSSIRRWFRSHSKQARFAPAPVSSTTSRRTAYALDPGSAEPSTREPCSNRPFSDLRPLRPQGPGRVCVHDPQVGALTFPTVALITSFWLAIRRIHGGSIAPIVEGANGLQLFRSCGRPKVPPTPQE